MTERFTEDFLAEEINNGYKHDAFFDTYCDDDSAFKNWIYTIKDKYFHVYMEYLFTKVNVNTLYQESFQEIKKYIFVNYTMKQN